MPLPLFIIAAGLAVASPSEVGVALDTLSKCHHLTDPCITAAGRLRALGDEAVKPTHKALPTMRRSGQLLALSVIDTRKDEAATKMLIQLAADGRVHPAVRALTLEELARRTHPKVVKTLLKATTAADSIVRSAGVRALANRPAQTKKIQQVFFVAAKDADPNVRIEAMYGLGFCRCDGAGVALTRGLNDPLEEVRGAAAQALSFVKHAPAIPGLIEVLEADSPLARTAAARALKNQTAQNFGLDRDRWASWYAAQNKTAGP